MILVIKVPSGKFVAQVVDEGENPPKFLGISTNPLATEGQAVDHATTIIDQKIAEFTAEIERYQRKLARLKRVSRTVQKKG